MKKKSILCITVVIVDKSYTFDNFMLILLTMFNMNIILLFSSLILKVMSKELPPAFGLNIGKGEGIQLLYRVRKDDTNCRFYQSTDADNSLMMYKDGDIWVIKLDSGATRAPPLNDINEVLMFGSYGAGDLDPKAVNKLICNQCLRPMYCTLDTGSCKP